MTESNYEHVLAQMREHLKPRSGNASHAHGQFRVGGHDVQLRYAPANASHAIQALLDLGSVDHSQREWIWYRLLVCNFEWGMNGAVSWALSPNGDHAVLSALHPLDGQTSGAELAGWLRELFACGKTCWQALSGREAVANIHALAPLLCHRRPMPDEPDDWIPMMNAFCDHIHLADRQSLLDGAGVLSVDGVDMLLRHDSAIPGRFGVHINMGMDMVVTREKLWQWLLRNNGLMGEAGRTLFSVHPQHDSVVLMLQQDIPDDPSPLELAEWLRAMAGLTKKLWVDARAMVAAAETLVQHEMPHALRRAHC